MNENITYDAAPAALCKDDVNGWSVVQLAGMSVIGEILRGHPNYTTDLHDQCHLVLGTLNLSGFFACPDVAPENLRYPTFIHATPKMNSPWRIAIVFPGTRDAQDLAFLIENVAPFILNSGLATLIPFYGIARRYFLETSETDIAQMVELAIAGPMRLSWDYWSFANTITLTILKMFGNQYWFQQYAVQKTNQTKIEPVVAIGHGAYGILAKGMAANYSYPGFAFQASQFQDSPVSVFQQWETGLDANAAWKVADIRSKRSLQVFSPGSTMAALTDRLPELATGIRAYFRTR
jgi:hypothetical protein